MKAGALAASVYSQTTLGMLACNTVLFRLFWKKPQLPAAPASQRTSGLRCAICSCMSAAGSSSAVMPRLRSGRSNVVGEQQQISAGQQRSSRSCKPKAASCCALCSPSLPAISKSPTHLSGLGLRVADRRQEGRRAGGGGVSMSRCAVCCACCACCPCRRHDSSPRRCVRLALPPPCPICPRPLLCCSRYLLIV